jgi:hypothetical protein
MVGAALVPDPGWTVGYMNRPWTTGAAAKLS